MALPGALKLLPAGSECWNTASPRSSFRRAGVAGERSATGGGISPNQERAKHCQGRHRQLRGPKTIPLTRLWRLPELPSVLSSWVGDHRQCYSLPSSWAGRGASHAEEWSTTASTG
jgi:hypothetical protein